MHLDPDWPIRVAAFDALRRLTARHGEELAWKDISEGFQYRGEKLHFIGKARGIFRPRQMQGAALSIKTTVPREGREARYDDLSSDDGFFYKFQGDDPNARDNRLLSRAQELDAPLIYFYGTRPGYYRPLFPVHVTALDPTALTVSLVVAAQDAPLREPGRFAADPLLLSLERRYTTVLAKKRLHQAVFRDHVLAAYEQRCAVCRFPRPELLDAAHILPDRDVRGRPEVPNGLSLCKLHHGAFDADLLGIRPDGIIEISRTLLDAQDGPTLEHGLKGFAGKRLGMLPEATALRPRGDYLEERYERFRKAG